MRGPKSVRAPMPKKMNCMKNGPRIEAALQNDAEDSRHARSQLGSRWVVKPVRGKLAGTIPAPIGSNS